MPFTFHQRGVTRLDCKSISHIEKSHTKPMLNLK